MTALRLALPRRPLRRLSPSGPRRAPRRGVTLTETLIGLTISLVVVGSVAPGFEAGRERRHLEGLAAQVETDIQLARGLAVAQDQTLRLSFGRGAAGSCYVVHSGPAASCSCGERAEPVCQPGAVPLRHALLPADGPASVAANVSSMVFDPVHGTVSPTGTVRVQAPAGPALHLVVNLMGRVRSCSPAPALPGHAVC